MYRPRIKELRRAYGFEEVAIVPGEVTINPELANTTFSTRPPHLFHSPDRLRHGRRRQIPTWPL